MPPKKKKLDDGTTPAKKNTVDKLKLFLKKKSGDKMDPKKKKKKKKKVVLPETGNGVFIRWTCAVPGCRAMHSQCSYGTRFNSMFGFHSIPENDELQEKWLQSIRLEKSEITSSTKVCGQHFLPCDMEEQSTSNEPRMLKEGALPVLFEWNNYSMPVAQKETEPPPESSEDQTTTTTTTDSVSDSTDQVSSDQDPNGQVPNGQVPNGQVSNDLAPNDQIPNDQGIDVKVWDHDYCSQGDGSSVQTKTPRPKLTPEEEERQKLLQEHAELLKQVEELALKNKFGLERFAGSDEDIRFYTGFESYTHLKSFWSQIEPVAADIARVTRVQTNIPTEDVPGIAALMCPQPIDEFFLFLACLTAGLDPQDMAFRCHVPLSTMIRIVVTWADFLYTALGSVDIWLDEETVKQNMPEVFGDYADTHIILESIELRCQTLDSVLLETQAFRGYKQYTMLKGLAGMAPHGPVTFVSPLYKGSITERDLLKQCGLVSLLQPSMAVMVDKRFDIEGVVPGKIYLPLQRSKSQEGIKTEVSMEFREHLFGVVGRLGKYQLFRSIIPFSLTGCINQMFAVACLLANYQEGQTISLPWEFD